MKLPSLLVVAALVAVSFASAVADPRTEELEAKLKVLAEEVRRLKEELAIPATDEELASFSGLGPAASKVYSKTSGLSIGGYGEYYFAAPTGRDEAIRTGDTLRFITYLGYKFSDLVVMNSEIEYEHGSTSRDGSVSVEFTYIDLLIDPTFSIRFGNLLAPIGFLNEIHEPPFYFGNLRPTIESRIIPTTWRELGLGIHGASGPVQYKAYVMNGFDAAGFSSTGIRGGRQKGAEVRWEDVGLLGNVDVQATDELRIGGGAYWGGADQGRMFFAEAGDSVASEVDVTHTILEAHVEYRKNGFRGRALVARSTIDEAGAVSRTGFDGDTPEADADTVIPEEQLGWYVEGGYEVSRWLGLPPDQAFTVWARFEDFNLHQEVDEGFTASQALDQTQVTAGVEWQPHPSVVFKGEFVLQDNEADTETDDPIRFGAGFVY